ncbi:uncharacterized protein [Pseudorasbora parva]|uniref:uncharacterized protein isoform X1 n=1 Tax=Pseudorasbora parva TaxID=51549 RepID=UPI00351F158E
MKKIVVNDRPHLCLFAVKKIEIGSEIEYNYGDSQWPWRKKGLKQQTCALKTKTSLTDQSSHDASHTDAAVTQGLKQQTCALKTKTSLTDQSSHDAPHTDAAVTQALTMKGFALVNYPDSDETDEDYIKDSPPTPHWEDVQKKMRNGNIQMVGVADFSDPLFGSSESIVEETDEDSSLQSDNENIVMDRVLDFSAPVNESSDDSTDEPSTSMSGMASQRPRRNRPMTLFQKHRRLKLRTGWHPCMNLRPQSIPNTRGSRQKKR